MSRILGAVQTVIHKLIHLRESKKITQVQLASSLKKHQSYVAKVENCERRLDFIELYDWLKILDTDIIQVLSEIEE
ncbi:helix-turn-helix domain-containing protein [Acinetobacter sp.]|uniref:helix-turn-helix domain-containing protein n=1 Tax=Acinetobacter sp. TaxID=472 RepID=UPI0035B32DAE